MKRELCRLKLTKMKTITLKTMNFLGEASVGIFCKQKGFSPCTLYSLKINFGDSFLCQWAPTFFQNSPIFQRVWINKVPLILKVFVYAKPWKWAKRNTNQFKNPRYFSGVGNADRYLWTPFLPVSDKQCHVKNLYVSEVEKSEAGQDKNGSGLFINTKMYYMQRL